MHRTSITKRLLYLLMFLALVSIEGSAQYKEFSTFFALEDAAGKKDTIWYEANKNAHNYELDADLGEVEVKEPIDSNRFFITQFPDNLFDPPYLSNKIVNKAYTDYDIAFNIIFVNAEFPVKITMDRAFLNEFDYRYNNYFMTYCNWPFLMDWPLMWYDAKGFECLLTDPIHIQDPEVKKAEYNCNEHYVYQIDVKGKGLQTFYGIEIATLYLDDYCYSQLNIDRERQTAQIIVIPNPAGDHLRVRLSAGNRLPYSIVNMAGRHVSKGITEYDGSINMSTIISGVYVITLTDSKHKTYRQRFIKR